MKQFKKVDHPELDALLKQVEGYVMTKEEKEAQRQSWFVGELMTLHPEMKREEVIERYKEASGGNILEDKEVKLTEAHDLLETRLEREMKTEGKLLDAHAVNLGMVGALEVASGQVRSGSAQRVIDNALSGDGIEKYLRLIKAVQDLLGTHKKIMSIGVTQWAACFDELNEAFAALQSTGEKT